jgi:hypothetical protein
LVDILNYFDEFGTFASKTDEREYQEG